MEIFIRFKNKINLDLDLARNLDLDLAFLDSRSDSCLIIYYSHAPKA